MNYLLPFGFEGVKDLLYNGLADAVIYQPGIKKGGELLQKPGWNDLACPVYHLTQHKQAGDLIDIYQRGLTQGLLARHRDHRPMSEADFHAVARSVRATFIYFELRVPGAAQQLVSAEEGAWLAYTHHPDAALEFAGALAHFNAAH
jgi:hypothetical protein